MGRAAKRTQRGGGADRSLAGRRTRTFPATTTCNFWIGILEQTILASVAATLTSDGIVE